MAVMSVKPHLADVQGIVLLTEEWRTKIYMSISEGLSQHCTASKYYFWTVPISRFYSRPLVCLEILATSKAIDLEGNALSTWNGALSSESFTTNQSEGGSSPFVHAFAHKVFLRQAS